MFTLSEHPPLCVGVGVFPCLFSSRICLCSEMGDLGAAFSQFANQGTTASDEVVQDLEAEIDELRAQLQETEENLQDSRSTLAREREFAELINQDNEDAQQQQAELQQTLLRSQNLETEFKKSKAERAELQDQLLEGLGVLMVALPPYWCELNPTELVFQTMLARMKAQRARYNSSSNDEFYDCIVEEMYEFSIDDCTIL